MSSQFERRVAKALENSRAEPHPAPDVLNAYAEHLLLEDEERGVVLHLAACEECRAVVFLAGSAKEEPAQPEVKLTPAPVVRWWTWVIPLIAVVIVACTSYMIRMAALNHRAEVSSEIAQARRDTAVQNELQPEQKPVVPQAKRDVVPGSPSEKDSTAFGSVNEGREGAESRNRPVTASPSGTMPKRSLDALAKAQPAMPMSAPAPAPSQNETVDVTASNAQITLPTQGRDLRELRTQTREQVVAGRVGYGKGIAPTTGEWRVTNDGKIEHLSLGEWKPLLNLPANDFLSISSVGNDVWVAGKNLAIYHSPDNGLSWVRQQLPAKSTDILHIEFSNANEGTLQTSSAGAFSTRDGGRTWVKSDLP